jgi:hypothetical protein
MTEVIDQRPADTSAATDLVAAIRRVLANSTEPLTLSKIRSGLPAAYRGLNLDELAESLRRQVAANVVIPYPKYRSQQDRFWDRPMPIHVAALLRETLAEGPLPWSELRRKLPAYALTQGNAETVLHDEVKEGRLFCHPRAGTRGKERYGVTPPEAKDYLRQELRDLFARMEGLGFNQAQLREGALELLHEEVWASPQNAGPEAEEQRQSPSPEASAAAPVLEPGFVAHPGSDRS